MPESERIVCLLSTDLMFGSTVSGFANAAGASFLNPASTGALPSGAEENSERLVLIDLETPGLNIAALPEILDTQTLESAIAYGPHVHTERLALAERVGIGTVMSRGQFHNRVGALIAAWAGK